MRVLKKYFLLLAGIALGGLAGYLYWKFIGCTSGSCPITSNPRNASLYGAVLGGLLMGINAKNKK